MAGTLLHVTLGNETIRLAQDSDFVDAVHGCPDDFALGCVFADLPYYDRLWISGVRAFAGLPIHYNAWGILIHLRSPRGLFLEILDRAQTAEGRAFALGCLTHYAVGLVFHPAIHRRVILAADGSRPLDSVHKEIEDQMDLHCHYELLGHSGMGHRYVRDTLALHPRGDWASMAAESILAIHSASPGAARLDRWRRNLALFGSSSSWHRVPWVTVYPKDDPALQAESIELAAKSIALAGEYLKAGASYLNGKIDRGAFFRLVPDRSMIDGAEADPPRR